MATGALTCVFLGGATVLCTGMIYRSLKPIPEWRQPWILPACLVPAAYSGSLMLCALTVAFGESSETLGVATSLLSASAAAVKLAYWRQVERLKNDLSLASATGLGHFGVVRGLDAPHAEADFVMREMGYVVARRHVLKLRRVVGVALFTAPALLKGASIWIVSVSMAAALAATLAASVSASVDLLVERWHFFAEARRHAFVYYDAA